MVSESAFTPSYKHLIRVIFLNNPTTSDGVQLALPTALSYLGARQGRVQHMVPALQATSLR